MSITIVSTVVTLSAMGTSAAVILYFVSRKFKVYEDPRIDEVENALPASNCGGCGYAGCRAFAEACVNATGLDDLNCPVGGNETMASVAAILGASRGEKGPQDCLHSVQRHLRSPSKNQYLRRCNYLCNSSIGL